MPPTRSPSSESFEPTELAVTPAPEVHDDDERTATTVTPAPPATRAGASTLAPGTMVGDYRIEGKLGEGGMGVVYAAVHPLIGKRAAIKVLQAELCTDPATVQRFLDEARVVNQIGHPNIVDIFAFGQFPDGRQYLVMELLAGEPLRARIARGRLGIAEACTILRPLVRALEAAHDDGVVHRDLKPDNVFLVDVRGDPLVKLLDFGIAKLARNDRQVERTASGAVMGTPQYFAPEQARGHQVDHRADLYALGGIAFEMLTGRPPFVADNALEIIAKHLMEPPPRPSSLVAGIPPALDALIVGLLAKEPGRRPPLAEVVRVLEEAQRGGDAATRTADRGLTPPPRVEGPTTAPGASVAASASLPATVEPRPPVRPRRMIWIAPLAVLVGAAIAFGIARSPTDRGTSTSATPAGDPAPAASPGSGGSPANASRAPATHDETIAPSAPADAPGSAAGGPSPAATPVPGDQATPPSTANATGSASPPAATKPRPKHAHARPISPPAVKPTPPPTNPVPDAHAPHAGSAALDDGLVKPGTFDRKPR